MRLRYLICYFGVLFLGLLWAVFFYDKKLFKKQIVTDDVEIDWYFYSYISDVSADFVEVTHKNSTVLIMESHYTLKDIELKNDTIILYRLYEGADRVNVEKKGKVFNYFIKYQKVTSAEMYNRYLKKESNNQPVY